MWLVSVSHSVAGKIVPTEIWTKDHRLRIADRLIDMVLDGRGDPRRERSFRMCITLCRHRAISDKENDELPESFHKAPATDIAGGPVEVLWSSQDMPKSDSVLPCRDPGKVPLPGQHELWLPVDCGRCPPCVARDAT